MEQVQVGQAPKIAIRTAGQGPLVIFLHGIGGNSLNWTGQIEALSSDYRAAAWDMRGYGASDDYDGPFLLDAVTNDLLQILGHFKTERAHLVGLSMGGMIALEFYRRFPDRVRSLLLCNTNSGPGKDFTPQQKAEFIRLRKTPLLEGRTVAELIPSMLPVLLGTDPSAEAVRNITDSLQRLRPVSYIKAIEAIMDFDGSDILAGIDVPVHLIAGSDDKVTPLSTMQVMCQRIPGAGLSILENSGHLSNLEQPEAFNAILQDFLARQVDR